MKTNFQILIVLLLINWGAMAQTATAPSGNGTSGDPYQIATLENLYWITASDAVVPSPTQATRWTKYYIQTADIDALATSGWDGSAGWTPIGNITTQFSGSYNGQGFAISGLFINRPAANYIGLFGRTSSPATISNLGITGVNITGQMYTGGLVGYNFLSTISKSYCTGTVASTNINIGGLVGHNRGGTISRCYSTATVTGTNICGGFVGSSRDDGTSNGLITDCYSTGNLTFGSTGGTFGGFAGGNYAFSPPHTSTIQNCYSTGSVANMANKGFLGDNTSATYINNFWDKETSGQLTTGGTAGQYATGKTSAQMKAQLTFTGWDFTTTPVWHINPLNNSGYPHLSWQVITVVPPLGSGTIGDPYQIATIENLYWITAADVDVPNTTQAIRWAACYIQTADIDASLSLGWDVGAGWLPIGNYTTEFSGTYDGDGYTISGLFINKPSTDNVGMFGLVSNYDNGVFIRNLGVVNAQIAGSSSVGGLIGMVSYNLHLSECYTTGTVHGGSYLGGMIGYVNYYNTQVTNCYSSVSISSTSSFWDYLGGLIGYDEGQSPGNSFTNCYSTGAVPTGNGRGGFMGGKGTYSVVTNCFWDTETSGITVSAGGTGKTTIEMKTQSTFTGWDFATPVWSLKSAYNSGYPNLDGQADPINYIWDGSTDTDWNTAANWTPEGVPTAANNVTIPGTPNRQPVVIQAPATPAVCKDLTIETGASLWISPGKALTVTGTLSSSNDYGLFLQSDATGTGSLIHNTDDVPAIVETFITGSTNLAANKFHFVSIPAKEINPTANIFLGSYLYKLDATQQEATNSNYYGKWAALGTSTTTPLNLHQGYMVYSPLATDNYTFMANLNNGDFSCAVAGHTGTYTFNLVPNPYPSAVNWGAATGWTKSAGIGGTCYVWGSNAGNYEYIPLNSPTGIIPIGQAFIVLVNNEASPVLTVKNAARVHSAQTFYKSAQESSSQLSIKADANNYSDVTRVAFNADATEDFDLQTDGMKMFGLEEAPQLYTLSGDKKYSINNLPEPDGYKAVPMDFETTFAGEVTLAFDGIGSFPGTLALKLEDKLTRQIINLRQQPTYTFSHQPANASDRFVLHFGSSTGIDESQTTNGNIWISGKTVTISSPASVGEKALVEIYNAGGLCVFSRQIVLSEPTKVPTSLSGFAVVRVSTGKEVWVAKGIF